MLESAKLQSDLQKVEQLEAKVIAEADQLRDKIAKMKTELVTFSNLDKVKDDAETRKKVPNVTENCDINIVIVSVLLFYRSIAV